MGTPQCLKLCRVCARHCPLALLHPEAPLRPLLMFCLTRSNTRCARRAARYVPCAVCCVLHATCFVPCANLSCVAHGTYHGIMHTALAQCHHGLAAVPNTGDSCYAPQHAAHGANLHSTLADTDSHSHACVVSRQMLYIFIYICIASAMVAHSVMLVHTCKLE